MEYLEWASSNPTYFDDRACSHSFFFGKCYNCVKIVFKNKLKKLSS